MSYFPESLMPSRIKQESADVDGNQFIISAADHNLHDSEIRSVEKFIGVPTLPVSGFSGPANPCSMIGSLIQVLNQIKALRDGFILPTSGVVAVLDPTVVGVDGKIPFPASWGNTTLQSDIPDDVIGDEDPLPALASVTLADVAGMPDEGYVTIINDASPSATPVNHSSALTIYSAPTANAKIGKDFLYEILANGAATFSATGLPAGLGISSNTIVGKPLSSGTSTATITASLGAQTAQLVLTINATTANTPMITSGLTASGVAGTIFSYTIFFTGLPNVVTMTGLPEGLTFFGQNISGIPHRPGVYSIQMKISDEFGDSDTQTLVLTVV